MHGQDPPSPAVPQAVKALEYLKAQPSSGPTSWTNGAYGYDGAGNIVGIGSESFVYDKVGRLRSATVRGPDLTSFQTKSFTYDPYGNLTSTTKFGQAVHLDPETTNTNRLQSFAYDVAGNVITSGPSHYEYDVVGMVNQIRIGTNLSPRIIYAYTADDERLFAFDVSANTTHWTVRGLDNKVLRDFKQTGATWSLERDYVYRDGLPLAAIKPDGAVEHYSVDHLGTPRLVTDGSGHKIAITSTGLSVRNGQQATPRKAICSNSLVTNVTLIRPAVTCRSTICTRVTTGRCGAGSYRWIRADQMRRGRSPGIDTAMSRIIRFRRLIRTAAMS